MGFKIAFAIAWLSISCYGLHAQTRYLKTVEELKDAPATENVLVVSNQLSGGVFVYSDSSLRADGGVVIARTKGGVWVRQFNKAEGANPCWWGAKGDGINDDLAALNAAADYCQEHEMPLQFQSGVFRISATWVIGAKTIDEADLFGGKLTRDKTFSMRAHEQARQMHPMIIRGSVSTRIYGDFDAKNTTAIIYYNIKSNGTAGRQTSHLYTHEFSNIGVYAKGCFAGAKPVFPAVVDTSNQQIGIAIVNSTNMKVLGCSFFGLKYGLLFKTSYFGSVRDCHFELCQTGLYGSDFNANALENLVGMYCKIVADITGGQLVFNNFNSEFCETTLIFKGKNIVLNGVYCENNLKKYPSNFQLIFGRSNLTENGFKTASTGIVINAVSIATAGRDAILLEEDMQQLHINGGNINGNIVARSARARVTTVNTIGSFKLIGAGVLQQLGQ